MNGKYVYLEEDCDAGTFLEYKFGENINYRELKNRGVITSKTTNNSSIIRSYDCYNPELF